MRFLNKTAMVTGAGKNIGKQIALDFAREGANVVVCDMNEENTLATVAEIEAMGGKAMAAVCDVRDREKVFAYVDEAKKRFGGVDILLPDSVNVEVFSTSVFGGVSNKKASTQGNAVTVYIDATCMFGGIDIE